MPAPSIIVTFTDQDGDEFPVQVPYTSDMKIRDVTDAAGREFVALMDDEGWMPALPMRLKGMEACNGAPQFIPVGWGNTGVSFW